MGKTSIEWSHYTFNPWMGCAHVSPGCEHCYAESCASFRVPLWTAKGWTLVGQHKNEERPRIWGRHAPRLFPPDAYLQKPLAWNRAAEKAGERRRVFSASMADILELHPDQEVAERQQQSRQTLWQLIRDTPALIWLVLTKRPENAETLLPGEALPNLWLGVTAEDQRRADERILPLARAPAAKRFLSYEPALGPLALESYLSFPSLDWVIAGAESGRGARPAQLDWFRSVRDQCNAAGVAFFLKQLVDGGKKLSLPELDGRRSTEVP